VTGPVPDPAGQPAGSWDPSVCQALREDVAVALLTRHPVPPEVAEHAQLCPPCADEFAELTALPVLLALVQDDSLVRQEQPSMLMLPRLMSQVSRRRRRLRWATLAGAAAVVAITIPVAFTVGQSDGVDRVNASGGTAQPTVSAPGTAAAVAPSSPDSDGDNDSDDVPAFARGESSDTVTGARAEVSVHQADWGSRVDVEIYDVPEGTQCRMVVIDRFGNRVESGSWTIPPGGYKDGQTFPETVMTRPSDVAAVDIVDNRTERVMLHVPVSRV
jgi:hypothetical protein